LIYIDIAIDDRADNCCEKVSWSLLKYMRGFEKRVTPILNLLKQKYPGVRFIEIYPNRFKQQVLISENYH